MRCDEPLFNEGENHSTRDCQLDLGHAGDHDYFGTRYPRPVGAEPDPAVAELIEAAAERAGAWGLDEMQWPIAVEVTSIYVIKAPGATEDEALKYWSDGDYPDLDGEQAIDGSLIVRRADTHEQGSMLGAPFGPMVACPGCGRLAMRREWYHKPLRRCHGPIEWLESRAPRLSYRYSRNHRATPAHAAPAGGAR
ncbi:hypothetical protein ACWF94_03560 [Streptomyces sp. NPDC055078]